jgi:hypothetical protein
MPVALRERGIDPPPVLAERIRPETLAAARAGDDRVARSFKME